MVFSSCFQCSCWLQYPRRLYPSQSQSETILDNGESSRLSNGITYSFKNLSHGATPPIGRLTPQRPEVGAKGATLARIGVITAFAAIAAVTVLGVTAVSELFRGAMREWQLWLAKTTNPFVFMILIVLFLGGLMAVGLWMVVLYFLFFGLPFLMTLPLTLPLAWRWRDPARLLVLRPFDAPLITPSLRRYLTQEASLFGHCYTLADSSLKVPLYVRIPFLLGNLALFNFHTEKIRQPRDLQKLAKDMNRRVMRNLNWVLSRHRLFAITCRDDAWQACVKTVVDRVDIVLLEISSLTPNMMWEFNLLRSSGALSRTILLLQKRNQADCLNQLCSDPRLLASLPIVTYGSGAPLGNGALTKALVDILQRQPKDAPADYGIFE